MYAHTLPGRYDSLSHTIHASTHYALLLARISNLAPVQVSNYFTSSLTSSLDLLSLAIADLPNNPLKHQLCVPSLLSP